MGIPKLELGNEESSDQSNIAKRVLIKVIRGSLLAYSRTDQPALSSASSIIARRSVGCVQRH